MRLFLLALAILPPCEGRHPELRWAEPPPELCQKVVRCDDPEAKPLVVNGRVRCVAIVDCPESIR